MLLNMEGWVRRMAAAHGGGMSGQRQTVRDLLAQAAEWLGCLCVSFALGMARLSSEAGLSGAQIRMQLSAAATMLKHRGLSVKAARSLTFLVMVALREESSPSPQDNIPHQLHFISLYIAGLQNQPGMDSWGLSSPPSGSSPLNPSPSPFTDNARAIDGIIISLHGVFHARLSVLAHAVGLGSHAVTVMTSGPLWEMFEAAARVGLHPYDRLRCSHGFDADGNHLSTSYSAQFIEEVSGFLKLLMEADVVGEDSSPGQGGRDLGNEKETTSGGLLSREQWNIILACLAAAHALLHSEALGCLVGQLWYIGVHSHQPSCNSSSSSSCSSQQMLGDSNGSASVSSCSDDEQEYSVGHLLFTVFSDLRSVMVHAFDFASCNCPRIVEGDDPHSASAMALRLKLRGISLAELEGMEGDMPLTFFDVPTRSQAGVREEGLSILAQMRSLATELLAMLHSNLVRVVWALDGASGRCCRRRCSGACPRSSRRIGGGRCGAATQAASTCRFPASCS